jgi:hypothetical protein
VDHSLEVPRHAALDGLMSNVTMYSNRPIHGGGIFSDPLPEGISGAYRVLVFAFSSLFYIVAFSSVRVIPAN